MYFAEKVQIKKAEGMREIESHHYNTPVIVGAGKIHW